MNFNLFSITSLVQPGFSSLNDTVCIYERFWAYTCKVALDFRQQWIPAKFAIMCKPFKLNPVHNYPMPGAPICRITKTEQERAEEAVTMLWLNSEEEPDVKTVILSDKTPAK